MENVDVKVPENEPCEFNDPFDKPVYFLGRDVRKIACFRDSIFFGIYCGVGGGLACFMWTSRGLFSTNIGYGCALMGLFSYWIPCRYKYETSQLIDESFKAELKKLTEKRKKVEQNPGIQENIEKSSS